MKKYFDCIVIGVGGIGSATCYFAAKKGWSVLGIERFGPAHPLGSSHGQTRIIRQAYFEHPSYVPLTLRAYRAWDEIEKSSNSKLFHQTGLLQVGWSDNDVIRGVLESATRHHLPVEQLSAQQCARQFPQFAMAPDQIGVFEATAGYLLVEPCVQTMIDLAKQSQADFLFNANIESFEAKNGEFTIRVDGETVRSRRVIITTGAWANEWLADLEIPLRVIRKHQHWFQFQNPDSFQNCPVYLMETEQGYFYGFPEIGSKGFKVAEHTSGEDVEDPTTVNRAIDPEDLKRVNQFVQHHLHAEQPTHHDHSVCMYTLSPDEHFVIDRHPENPDLVFACGMSGHGFKFTPVIGQQLIELLDEPSLHDPDFEFLRWDPTRRNRT